MSLSLGWPWKVFVECLLARDDCVHATPSDDDFDGTSLYLEKNTLINIYVQYSGMMMNVCQKQLRTINVCRMLAIMCDNAGMYFPPPEKKL